MNTRTISPSHAVNLTKRIKVDGTDRYFPVVFSANGRLKPDYVYVSEGQSERHPTGNYYIDWTDRATGKRKRKSVGTDASEAHRVQLKMQAELSAVAHGVLVLPMIADDSKRSIAAAVEDFLEEVRLTKQPATLKVYRIALAYFQESCSKRFIEDIVRLDLLHFSAFLKNKKAQSPRSVHNKFASVLTFLTANGVPKLVLRNDRPRFVREQVEMYEREDIRKLLEVCSPYHQTLYQFLLMTGLREQEAMYCVWDDLNLEASTVNMRWKPQYDFSPKAYREREIHIPTKLIELLKSHKPKNAKGKELLFHTASGLPDTHMLRALKRNAVKAGLDRERFWIHKFRATFATMHLQGNGIDPGVDLRTVQAWLGHSNLESTIRYLKPARSSTVRDRVNATFA
jgi:integrase/recombinase XerD